MALGISAVTWATAGLAFMQSAAGVAATSGVISGGTAMSLGAGSRILGGMAGLDAGLFDVLEFAQFEVLTGQMNVSTPSIIRRLSSDLVSFTGAIQLPKVPSLIDGVRAPAGLGSYDPVA